MTSDNLVGLSTFQSDGWGYCMGSIPSKSRTSAVMKIYVHGHTDAKQQRRLGTNIFHGEQYWQGFGMFSRPPIAIVSMKFSLMHRLNLLQEKFEKAHKIHF